MQENDVEGVGRECVVREWRVEERRLQVSGIKFFKTFTSYFPTNIKITFIYLGLEAMMKKKGKK